MSLTDLNGVQIGGGKQTAEGGKKDGSCQEEKIVLHFQKLG